MKKIKINLNVPIVEEDIFTEEPMPTHYTAGSDTSGLDAIRSKIRKIAQGKTVAPLRVVHFEDPKDFLRVLTPKRFELFQYVRKHGGAESIEELSTAIDRDRETVSRDLKELARMGFVRLLETASPGHGKRVSVRPPEGELELRFRA